MSPSSNFFRVARPAFRARHFFRPKYNGARFQSTAANPEEPWLKRMWNSPVGLKTVHFWCVLLRSKLTTVLVAADLYFLLRAPIMKWALVLAGVSDFARPAEKLSFTQNVALTATGLIWTRWCLIIKPRNIL